MIVFDFLLNGLEIFILFQFCRRMMQPLNRTSFQVGSTTGLSILLLYGSQHVDNSLLRMAIIFVIYTVYLSYHFQTTFPRLFLGIAVFMLVGIICELISFGMINQIIHVSISDLQTNPVLYTLGTLNSKLMLIFIMYCFIFSDSPQRGMRILSNTVMYSLLPLVTIILIIALMQLLQVQDELSNLLIVAVNGLTLLNMGTYYLVRKSMVYDRAILELEVLKTKEKTESKYYEILKQNMEEMNMLRHDMNKHLQAMHYIEELSTYLGLFEENVNQTFVLSGVATLDVAINARAVQLRESGIKLTFDIHVDSLDALNILDQNIIFANLMDNGIAASQRVNDPFIHIRIHNSETDYIIIQFINASLPPQISDERHIDHLTSHYGMKILRRVAKKYEGSFSISYDEQASLFESTLVLYNKEVQPGR